MRNLKSFNYQLSTINCQLGKIIAIILVIAAIFPMPALAAEGECGYEGGISTGIANKNVYEYKEVTFITGKPVVLVGTVTIKKTIKSGTEVWKYTYTNLKNTKEKIIINRAIQYTITSIPKSNGQIQKQVTLTGTPVEKISINNYLYTLNSYNFSKSTIVDVKPFIQYFAGEFVGEKNFTTVNGLGTTNGQLTVTTTGKTYGYNQYWSNAESQTINYVIKNSQDKTWTGTATIGLSLTSTKNLNYELNTPDQISFEGGYVQTQNNLGLLQYQSKLPEFDTKGIPTDYLINTKDTLRFDTFPQVIRLPIPPLPQLKGHWAENDIKLLYSLEIFKESPSSFNPNAYITRGEFAKDLILSGKILTDDQITAADSSVTSTSSTEATASNTVPASEFTDVPVSSPFYPYIKTANDLKIMSGTNSKIFQPDSPITKAEAITLLVRALGLESKSPNPTAVTTFNDNDKIPAWARNCAYVAQSIGLIKGDTQGNMLPDKKLTQSEIAVMLSRFINYMRQDIIKDYQERSFQY
jgi:hypothetical protein